jgi:hypothetical protein
MYYIRMSTLCNVDHSISEITAYKQGPDYIINALREGIKKSKNFGTKIMSIQAKLIKL